MVVREHMKKQVLNFTMENMKRSSVYIAIFITTE